MYDYYTNERCSNGYCPLLLEDQLYGIRGDCKNYCEDFNGCNTCYFEGSRYCNECMYYEGKVMK